MKQAADTIPPILVSNLPAIQELCQKYKVKHLWVFGSVLAGEFRSDSDIDFLYELDKPAITEGEYLYNLDGLIAGLLELFPGRKLDMVHYPSLKNPYFIEEVEETKVLLYEQNREEVSV
ncbi:MAG: nucleotidyltransferase domain-containing protein [Lewinellaceae bacterium]|nr:nucleotidyltransferase domain-containing protein [Lewinellaceae bacterium]